ncbi:MAG: hypothetical protein Q6K81_02470, partial [Gloeomargarita sp. DG02_5_bins_242]
LFEYESFPMAVQDLLFHARPQEAEGMTVYPGCNIFPVHKLALLEEHFLGLLVKVCHFYQVLEHSELHPRDLKNEQPDAQIYSYKDEFQD